MPQWLLGFFLLFPSPAPNDWLIVPGHRAGPITAETTHTDLIRIFGVTNVHDEEQDVGEGNFQRVTVLNKRHPEISALILWPDGDLAKPVEGIQFCIHVRAGCHWHTREQITMGTSLKTLEKLNDRPFTLAGFGWDYGGTVMSFNSGNLSRLKPNCGVFAVRLEPPSPKPAERKSWLQLVDQVTGDRDFSSTHPAMQALNPKVEEMGIYFSDCGK